MIAFDHGVRGVALSIPRGSIIAGALARSGTFSRRIVCFLTDLPFVSGRRMLSTLLATAIGTVVASVIGDGLFRAGFASARGFRHDQCFKACEFLLCGCKLRFGHIEHRLCLGHRIFGRGNGGTSVVKSRLCRQIGGACCCNLGVRSLVNAVSDNAVKRESLGRGECRCSSVALSLGRLHSGNCGVVRLRGVLGRSLSPIEVLGCGGDSGFRIGEVLVLGPCRGERDVGASLRLLELRNGCLRLRKGRVSLSLGILSIRKRIGGVRGFCLCGDYRGLGLGQ